MIPRRERLIVALDVPGPAEARSLVQRLGDSAAFYKIGLELFCARGGFDLADWLAARGAKVFADLKLHDIPQTVRRAVANLRASGASFLTVHGERAILEAAASEKGAMKVLAVTVLTSLGETDLKAMGFALGVPELVRLRARAALEAGCDGVIASGHEALALKGEFGARLLVVTPGIRPGRTQPDDQKRTMDVAEAFAAGADYIVVGRPIRDAADPRAAAEAIQQTIAGLFRE